MEENKYLKIKLEITCVKVVTSLDMDDFRYKQNLFLKGRQMYQLTELGPCLPRVFIPT